MTPTGEDGAQRIRDALAAILITVARDPSVDARELIPEDDAVTVAAGLAGSAGGHVLALARHRYQENSPE